MSNIKEYSKKVCGNDSFTKNFKYGEFACKDGTDIFYIDNDIKPILQYLRDRLGAITINSAYRTKSWNAKQGGATNSYHLNGMAFDLSPANKNLDLLCKIANSLGILGIIKYQNFVHIDTRTTKYHYNMIIKQNVDFGKAEIPFVELASKGKTSIYSGLVQLKLKRLGLYSGNIDCVFGDNTNNAVMRFQQKNNLTVDGIVGKNTWNKLFN